jgi:hypothetical protein
MSSMGQTNSQRVLFSETQHFSQWWVWVLVLGVAGLEWWSFVEQIILRRPFGNNPAPDWMVIVFTALFGIGLPCLIVACRLETAVTAEGVILRFAPFHLRPRFIPHDGIREIAARRYNALLEYGGWGIKYGRGGEALNVSGNEGVQFVFTNGKRLLIGSQRAAEFVAAIARAQQRVGAAEPEGKDVLS